MNNDVLDKLARECGLGSIYERPQPVEIGGVIKWKSSGEVTPFGHCLIRFFNESQSINTRTEAERIEKVIEHLISRTQSAGKISTLNYKHISCTYNPTTMALEINNREG